MSNSYKDQEVIELNEREQCRLKLPIFFGDRSNFEHSLREVLANSRDEILNNFDSGIIYVKLHDDNETVEILDTGRGINLQGETNGVKNYFLLLEKLWAGGNHNNLELGIASTGTNSVGLTCTNYCASLFEATSYKCNKFFKVSYKDGGMLVGIEEGKDNNIEHGTRIKFKQDKDVYTSTVFDSNRIEELCNKLAGTTDKIEYIYEHKDETKSFKYESQEDYLRNNATNFITEPVQFPLKNYETNINVDGKEFIEKDSISLNISLSTDPLIESYLNGTYLVEHGSIEDGILDGLKKCFQKAINNKVKLTTQDIEMSFNIHCIFTSTNPSFSGQTKFSSASPLYKKLCTNYTLECMEIFKAESPKEFDQMLKHLTQINSFNTRNQDNIKKIKKELSEKATSAANRPKKLIPCRSKNPNEIELILIEGDSAMTSVKASRDPNTMMILPLKGKPINALKKSLERLLENQEVLDIFKILECGITYKGKNVKGFDKFDINKLAVNKILITTDFDDDGFHIQALLIGLFYILAPQLLIDGIVEFIQTPLYLIKTKTETFKAYSENERQRIISGLDCKYSEVRFKGIGGLPVKTMKEALSLDTRISYQVTMEDAKKCAEKIELFLSDDIETRKKYIEDNGADFVNETLFI